MHGPADLRGEPPGQLPRASTSCARSAASTRACRAACTCTWATGKTIRSRCTRRCSARARRIATAPWTTAQARERVARVDALLEEVEGAARRGARDTAIELVAGAARPLRRGARADRRPPSRRDGEPRGARERRARRALLLLHGLHPVPRRGAGARGARRGAAVPRVPRRRRRAARRSRTASCACAMRGQLRRLPVVGDDAEARDRGRDPQAPRPTSSEIEAEGARRGAPAAPRRCCRSSSTAGGADPRADGDGAGRRPATLPDCRRRRLAQGRRAASRCCSCALDGDALRLPPELPGVRRRRSRAPRWPARSCAARAAARATTSRRAGRVRWTRPSSISSPCRCSSATDGVVRVALRSGRHDRDALVVAAAHGAARGRASARRRSSTATCAASRSPPSTGTSLDVDTRELMCACRAVHRCCSTAGGRRGRPPLPARPRPPPAARRLRARTTSPGTSCASRSTWRSSSTARRPSGVLAFYPGPMGATESLLELERVGGARGGQPGARHAGARRRGAARQPRARRARSTGSCRSTTATSSSGLIRTRWRGPDRRARGVGGDRALLRRPRPPRAAGRAASDERRRHGDLRSASPT